MLGFKSDVVFKEDECYYLNHWDDWLWSTNKY